MHIGRDITKDEVLALADDITIFSKYLDIPESTIIECIEKNTLISSPLRFDDNDASAGFRYSNKGRLKLRDFSGYFWGDCFDLVAYVLNKNVNNKSHFIYILKHIYETVTAKGFDKINVNKTNRDTLIKANREKRKITIETRPWNIHDRAYWNDFLYKETDVFGYLERNFIFPVKHYWIDIESQPAHKYYYQGHDPCYAYFFGYDENGVANYRLYFPFRKKPFPKFITNNASYQGLDGLRDNVDALLITKSYKDVVSVKSFIRNNPLVIDVIAPPSENHVISNREFEWLASRVNGKFANDDKSVKAVLSLFDFDRTGLNGSGHLKRNFGVPRFMFTDGRYGTAQIGNKDFSATIPMYGKLKFHNMIDVFIHKLNIA